MSPAERAARPVAIPVAAFVGLLLCVSGVAFLTGTHFPSALVDPVKHGEAPALSDTCVCGESMEQAGKRSKAESDATNRVRWSNRDLADAGSPWRVTWAKEKP